jgi:hypothetical protein
MLLAPLATSSKGDRVSMLCLQDSIRDDAPFLQRLLPDVEDPLSLTVLLLATWQVAHVLAVHLVEAVLDERARRPTTWPPCPTCGVSLRSKGTLIGSRALQQPHPGSIGIMSLLKSHWSNPMKHLIPYLQDDRKAADDLRQVQLARWCHVSTLWQRCGRAARTVLQRTAGTPTVCTTRRAWASSLPCARIGLVPLQD